MAKRKPAKRKKDPTKMIRERACRILKTATFRDTTRKRLGISRWLWGEWIREGKKEIEERDAGVREELGPRGLFVEAIEKVEGEVHDKLLQDGVMDAGPEAKRWYLKVRYPELYGSGASGRPVLDDESGTLIKIDPRELLKQKLRELLEGSDEG